MTARRQRTYEPKRLTGRTIDELRDEMQSELDDIAETLVGMTELNLLPIGAMPRRYGEGAVRFFLPGVAGSLGGLYQYRDGAWRRLMEE